LEEFADLLDVWVIKQGEIPGIEMDIVADGVEEGSYLAAVLFREQAQFTLYLGEHVLAKIKKIDGTTR